MKKLFFCLMAFLVYMLTGCVSDSIVYWADPEMFSDAQLVQLEHACEYWNYHAIRQCYITTDRDDANHTVALRDAEHMPGPPGASGVAHQRYGLVYLLRTAPDNDYTRVFAHEHGHILGLANHLPAGSGALMTPSAESDKPTELDIKYCRDKGLCR